MRTTDILIIIYISIWLTALLFFGILAYFKQCKINKVKLEKETYKNNEVILNPIQLDFKLPEGEICYLNLKNQQAKLLVTKKSIVESNDKFYVMNAWKIIRPKNITVDLYFTNKNIVIVSKANNYKLKIEEGTIVKPGVKYVNNHINHEVIIKLDEKLYFLLPVKDKNIYQTYETILNK